MDGENSSASGEVAFEPIDLDQAVAGLTRRWSDGIRTVVVDRLDQCPVDLADVESVSLRRLNRIVRMDVANAAVIAEAGVSIGKIRETVQNHGLWCPALRWLPENESIGAAVAGGHGRRSRKYGAVVDYLLGSRFACPSVGLTRYGGLAIKNAIGYNLTGAVAGSRGELAVVLEVILRLVPRPAGQAVRVFATDESPRVWAAARAVARSALDDSTEAVVVRSLASVEAWSASLTTDSALAVEIETADREAILGVSDTIDRRAAALGLSARPLFAWPPGCSPTPVETRRYAVDPAVVAEAAARIEVSAVENHVTFSVLAETTGGALEVASYRGSRWLGAIDPDLDSRPPWAETNGLRASLKAAFDPRGLLRKAPGH